MLSSMTVAVRGRVQGVGFRPFVFQIARLHGIRGTVQNNMDGVKIRMEANESAVQAFLSDLRTKAPRMSKIDEISVQETDPAGYSDFTIIPSEKTGSSLLVLPVDSAVCSDCLEEMDNPDDARYQYPFINCTQCGPRYTIISNLPYDRPSTSMAGFEMCEDCKKEYEDPLNRRHHAQPIACPKCGPSVKLIKPDGDEMTGEAFERTRELLKSGSIIAIKGLGGYHLCCDAKNENTVSNLRRRKGRPSRPLAVMAKELETIERYAIVDRTESKFLTSPEAPIVILKKKDGENLAQSVAPGMSTIGFMLPYTPLHHLLFQDPELDCIVMTSANPSGQPILYDDSLALIYLTGIADYFLVHDRQILHPADDSVIQAKRGEIDFLRRSRGYVPDPIYSPVDVNGIVAFGGQQKTTFTIGRTSQVFVGPHIGDLENLETIDHYKKELNHLLSWIQIPLQTAVIDMHPGYNTRNILMDYQFEEAIEVQHHHAHMAACMAENEILGADLWGIILDGTGYGEDGNIWGFEIFKGNEQKYTRKAHLRYTPLPGGERAIKEPWRNAAGMLMNMLGKEGEVLAAEIFPKKKAELSILKKMVDKNINSPLAGTCGRMFDAVSAICGVCEVSSYDGEAAIKLSDLIQAEDYDGNSYPFEVIHEDSILIFDFSSMLRDIARDQLDGKPAEKISLKFHETVVKAICKGMGQLLNDSSEGTKKAVLSGGSFHNRYLRQRIKEELEGMGLEVYVHQKLPCNDGGLSYGQLAVAAAKRGR
ncbi:carbamoyltransferase HypF [Bacillus sp. REN3]|uniref:carbamoyltransferase HypF n=1 Tax=Bacillus sp. REN3 TaxID=2802440 RepID=UPI001AEE18CB|nr:carbamoyltransferase HypF [Bacillus sp. REN3]